METNPFEYWATICDLAEISPDTTVSDETIHDRLVLRGHAEFKLHHVRDARNAADAFLARS